MQRFKVTLQIDSGIPNLMRNYCNRCGISVWKFLADTVRERLEKPLDFSITEIEEMQKRPYKTNVQYERFDFGISDAIVLEKLRIIKDDYGISLNTFFVKIIAEKLKN